MLVLLLPKLTDFPYAYWTSISKTDYQNQNQNLVMSKIIQWLSFRGQGVKPDFAGEYLKALAKELEEKETQGGNQSFNHSLNVSLLPTILSKSSVQAIISSVNEESLSKLKCEYRCACVIL